MSAEPPIAEFWDRQAIIAVLHRYIEGICTRNGDLIAGCFTDDAVVDYGFTTLRGRAEIEGQFGTRSPGIAQYGIDRLVSSMQQLPNMWITLNGDEAVVHSEGSSTHAGWRGDQPIVVMRSLTYDDELVRIEGEWRIRSRVHTPGWLVELPAREMPEPPPI